MGEAKRHQLGIQTQALGAMVVDTPGGQIHVQWDHGLLASRISNGPTSFPLVADSAAQLPVLKVPPKLRAIAGGRASAVLKLEIDPSAD